MTMPDWLEPMAATLTQERFTGPEWVFERKFDGIRLLAYKRGADVRLFSRNRLPQHLPAVAAPSPSLPVDELILDGEVTWDGRSGYHVFDILWLDGRDVTALPLEERRAPCSHACRSAAAAPRRAARRREPVGAGLARGLGRRHRQAARLALRAPPLAALAEDEVRGVAGTRGRRVHRSAGRTRRSGRAARRLLRRRATSCSPARSAPASTPSCCCDLRARLDALEHAGVAVHEGQRACRRLRAHWVRPEIVVQVGVHRVDGARQAAASAAARRPRRQGRCAQVDARAAVITHPEKVLFPDDGITKGDLAAYYEAVAPVMLPHLRGRPITMERYPAGIGKKGFWQKDVSKGFPDWLQRVEVPKKDGVVHHPLVTDTRSLLWVTNQNTITQHVWTSRAPRPRYPDVCVFDLDPSADDPAAVRAAAIELRDLLDELSCRRGSRRPARRASTSSSRSTARRTSTRWPRSPTRWARCSSPCARSPDAGVQQGGPPRAASTWTPAGTATARRSRRPTRVRARPGAPVSAPCTWEEIERGEVSPGPSRCETCPSASRRSATCGPACGGAAPDGPAP